MAPESRELNFTRGSSSSRISRGLARALLAVAVLAGTAAALQAQGGDKAKVAEDVKSDLSRLADLERSWFEKNRTFTTDLRALGFAPSSGANVTMAYASARSWAANATHPSLTPTTCFIVVSQSGGGANDRPFCSEASSGQVAAAPQAARQQPAAPQRVNVQPNAPATQTPRQTAAKPAAPPATTAARRPVRRAAAPPPVPTTVVEIPARAPSNAAALAATRAAGGVADAGLSEAVTPSQFTERLNAVVAAALDVSNAKMPEVARDPYESSAEYQARVAQAYSTFQRRETEFYARNTRTYIVSIPV
ncbi:MAG: hypothetical protein H3C62_09935, partial [Gemmatimonadaceae bacterium]|nr:hypothetical protein [Gemmatimonadaceae bacterium]